MYGNLNVCFGDGEVEVNRPSAERGIRAMSPVLYFSSKDLDYIVSSVQCHSDARCKLL